MIGLAIATTVSDEIDAADIDAGTRTRLRRCLPVLHDAVTAWHDDGGFAAPGLMIMAYHPTGRGGHGCSTRLIAA
jgi:hypothetical protein